MSTIPQHPCQELVSIVPNGQEHADSARKEPRAIVMNFLEGPRTVTLNELRENDITRHQVTKFYREQIERSGYYEQLKHIVEPSLKEFKSPGLLDTSGEQGNTVVPGLQHKYPQTGLLLVTDRCASYCRYCFRKRSWATTRTRSRLITLKWRVISVSIPK